MLMPQLQEERLQKAKPSPEQRLGGGQDQIEEPVLPPLDLSDLGGLGQSHISKPLLGAASLVGSNGKSPEFREEEAARHVLRVESCSSLSSNA